MTLKRGKVVMLPTKEKSNIWLRNGKLEYNSSASKRINPQHLYILNHEEIKKERLRWIMDNREGMNGFIHQVSVILDSKLCPEIIASTNSALKWEFKGVQMSRMFELPQPSQSFIEKYVEEYNKGNIITEVMVEYEDYWIGVCHSLDVAYRPKVSKDNTITIKKLKDSWTREEVKILFDRYNEFIAHHEPEEWNKWIEENL